MPELPGFDDHLDNYGNPGIEPDTAPDTLLFPKELNFQLRIGREHPKRIGLVHGE